MNDKIKELCIDGLCTDGGHHKQWYLEQILLQLEIDLKELSIQLWNKDAEEDDDPEWYENTTFDDNYYWEDGIAP